MPIHDYYCEPCGTTFEEVYLIGDEVKLELPCVECGMPAPKIFSAPAYIMTDSVYMAGHCNGNQFEGQPQVGDYYAHQAKKAGVSIKGKRYIGALADRPGDPEAWIDGRGDILRVAKKKGKHIEGTVNYSPPTPMEAPKSKCGDVADDVLNRAVAADIAKNGPVSPKKRADHRESVRERIRPWWKKDALTAA